MFGSQLQQESKSVKQEDKKKEISNTKPESAFESRSFNRTESSPIESWSTKDPVPSSGELKIQTVISVTTCKLEAGSEFLGFIL